jgi:hypothetical protein
MALENNLKLPVALIAWFSKYRFTLLFNSACNEFAITGNLGVIRCMFDIVDRYNIQRKDN